MTQLLAGKSILITGGGAGIGRATAQVCAAHGARVLVTDLDPTAAADAAEDIRNAGGEAHALQVDVRDAAQIDHMIQTAVATFGALDGAFNNAGVSGPPGKPLADCDEDEWDRLMEVNLKGVWLCMRAEIRHMVQHGGGSIVNASSIVGLIGSRLLGLYAASKHGVLGLTRSAALQYGNAGIRVNAICPSWVDTAIFHDATAASPQLPATIAATSPVGRLALPSEVGEAVAWLLSDGASYINGAPLPVDGGWTAQ